MPTTGNNLLYVLNIPTLKTLDAHEGQWTQTAGFHTPGDGGASLYKIAASSDAEPNGADIIALDNGGVAILTENTAINYRQFGAVGEADHDDGVQIKRAHEYANDKQVPIINLSGEYWIKHVNDIPITTNVKWGKTTFHIDERYNSRKSPRFVVHNDRPTEPLDLTDNLKASLLDQIKPGVQIIPELAPYAGCLITVVDEDDRIGIRAGNYSKAGWAREEFFYVEEEGRIIGDIAWSFSNFTSATVTPCNDTYLTIEGGGFYFSGETPEDAEHSYYQHGILIQRSRTIVREQWMGLERGRSDDAMVPRSGFYVLRGVYDVTLENIRAMPWEKNRVDKDRELWAGTYGIGGARMLNCQFRNLTAEAGWVSWGVFGTNLNKNFRVENCRLNRIDVHFHCWNLTISNCEIGFKGISVTGGGELVIENTTRHGNQLVNFRRDYAAKWEGSIRLSGCTLRPTGEGKVAVLSYHPDNFDYQYPIGFGRHVTIEDLNIDYGAAPESESPCWLMDIVPFSKTDHGDRLFFPHRIVFRGITVEGRTKGVRLINIPDPYHYELSDDASYDDALFRPNCSLLCEDVQLEALIPQSPGDTDCAHLMIGSTESTAYADSRALQPDIRFVNCSNVSVFLGNSIAGLSSDRCTINTIAAPSLKGAITFTDCRLQPSVKQSVGAFYIVDSSLGTRFTNCTIHAPVIDGAPDPAAVDRSGFLEINGLVKHYHLNTTLGNEILHYLRDSGASLTDEFIDKLKSHHDLKD